MDRKSLGRYEIVRALENAPWGPVYEGRDAVLQRKVVLHCVDLHDLSPQAAHEFTERFQDEAAATSRVSHPGIVGIADFGRTDDLAYLVVQHVDGETLKARLERGERMAWPAAVALVKDLLDALGHAHACGIVHRSVRPAHLLLADGRIKLAGLGMACIQQSEATTGAKLGVLAVGTRYMSPEQVQGQPLEFRSDLFSAGVVLYELLTGACPFEGDNPFATIQRIVTLQPPAPSQLDPALPGALDAILARALAKDKAARFASAAEFGHALAALSPVKVPAAEPQARVESTIALELELEYWKDIKESEDAADFLEFLKTFPAGRFAPLAQRRLRLMGQGAT
ncbi:serine/threonine protein kinase [Ramlibacter sp. XY19]|uniref:serine/threonine-protein kinase n=1 Tax=Ramlibacter paludis TaxID=2908000 RepID=UPI0023DB9EC3|nr:serine/threonine-protein kinase [Ramlibacter paludis]MCG2591715.1 serine/threonine protein kinase [Ramlibacter paludis]